MRKARLLLILGVLMAAMPYLGFPESWKETFYTLLGIGLIYFSYIMYKESKVEEKVEPLAFDNFQENGFSSEE